MARPVLLVFSGTDAVGWVLRWIAKTELRPARLLASLATGLGDGSEPVCGAPFEEKPDLEKKGSASALARNAGPVEHGKRSLD